MAKKGKIDEDRKRKILIASIILTAVFDSLLIGFSFQYANNQKSNPFHESAEPYYFTFTPNYTGPNYFFPYANLDFAVVNKYSDEISGFHFFLSFDNSSWVEIPLTKPLNIPPDFPPAPEENYILTNVGKIPLNGFSNVLYAKCVFPPQGFNDTTRTRIMNSFEGYLYIDPVWTPQSTATMVLVSVALVSFFIQILDFWFKEKTEKKEKRKTQNLISTATEDKLEVQNVSQSVEPPTKDKWWKRWAKWDKEWSKKHPRAIWIVIIVFSMALSLTFFVWSIPFGFFIILSTDAVKTLIEAEATILGFFGLIAVYLLTSFDTRIDKLEEKILDSSDTAKIERFSVAQRKLKDRKMRATIAILSALTSLILSFFLSIVILGLLGLNDGHPSQTALNIAVPLIVIASMLLFIGIFSIFLMLYRIGREPE